MPAHVCTVDRALAFPRYETRVVPPRHMPLYARPFSRLLSLSLFMLPACSDEDPCERAKGKVESCDRMFQVDVCQDEDDRCYTQCYGRASCAELSQVDDGKTPEWLSRCFAKCAERLSCDDGQSVPEYWRCDGAKDCVDGKDEKGCQYHTCNDGQLVRAEAPCDQYSDCQDGSDELGCGDSFCDGGPCL